MKTPNQLSRLVLPVLIVCGLLALVVATGIAVVFLPVWITLSIYALFLTAGMAAAIFRRKPHSLLQRRQFDEEIGLHAILEELNERDRLLEHSDGGDLKKSDSSLFTGARWKGSTHIPQARHNDRN